MAADPSASVELAVSFEVEAAQKEPEPLKMADAAERGAATGAPGCCAKVSGAGVAAPPRPPLKHTAWSFVGSFVALSALGLGHHLVSSASDGTFKMIIPPFGAMAVLVFSAHSAPLAQPKNVILGNTIGAVVGYTVWNLADMTDAAFGRVDCTSFCSPTGHLWLTAALTVALTIFVQERMGAVHPPGGATALVYVTVPSLREMGCFFIFCPSLVGACLFVAMGILVNNASRNRAYPQSTWTGRPLEPGDNPEAPSSDSRFAAYLPKFFGAGVQAPPPMPLKESIYSFIGAFVGMATLALIPRVLDPVFPAFPDHLVLGLEKLLIGPFGAMAVLVFSACKAPLAQPKNVIVGNGIGALAGVLVVKASTALAAAHMFEGPDLVWLKAAFAVSLTIAGQELCAAGHPPGAATAMIFVLMAPLQQLGFWYVLVPGILGAMLLVGLGLLTNNLSKARTYPERWR